MWAWNEIFPHLFFQFPFSFLGQRQEVEGETCTALQTVGGFIQKGPGQQQLFLSQRNARTTVASFVLLVEPREGHLKVSVSLKRVRDPREGASASVSPREPPPLQTGKVLRAPQGLVQKSGHPSPYPRSSPNELEKHLVSCNHSVNIYWVGHCAKTVVPSHRPCRLVR